MAFWGVGIIGWLLPWAIMVAASVEGSDFSSWKKFVQFAVGSLVMALAWPIVLWLLVKESRRS